MYRLARSVALAGAVVATLGAGLALAVPATAVSAVVVSCSPLDLAVHANVAQSGAVSCSADAGGGPNPAIDSYAVVDDPTHAADAGFTFDTASGSFSYTPAAGFIGVDSFTFMADAGGTMSGVQTVTLTVGNSPATCVGVTAQTVGHDQQLTVTPSCSDINGDTFTLQTGATAPAHGSLSVVDGTLLYTPNLHYVGPDSFSFHTFDGIIASSDQTVSLTVTNVVPSCTASVVASAHDRAVTVPIDCVNIDEDELTMSIVAQPAHGTATLVPGQNAIRYVPDAHFTGTDALSVQAFDGLALSNTVVDHLTVTNSAPTISPRAGFIADAAVSFPVAFGDADHDRVWLQVATPARHGLVTVHGMWVSYTPAAGYVGPDTFAVRGTDGLATTAAHPIAVQVHPALPQIAGMTLGSTGTIAISCLGFTHNCAGTADLRVLVGGHFITGRAGFLVGPGRTGAAVVRLTLPARQLIAASKHPTFGVLVVLHTADSAGRPAVVSKTVTATHVR